MTPPLFKSPSLWRRILFLVIAILGCGALIVGGLAWLRDYLSGPAFIPPEALVGVDAESARVINVGNLSIFTLHVPEGTVKKVFQAKLPNGQWQRRLFLECTVEGVRYQKYIGILESQFPDSPLQTIMFEIAGDRFIVGYIDESVAGTLDSLWLTRVTGYPLEESLGLLTKISIINNRVFFIPIFAAQDDYAYWHSITEISIYTIESSQREWNTTNLGTEWRGLFDPPFEIEDLFIAVEFNPPDKP